MRLYRKTAARHVITAITALVMLAITPFASAAEVKETVHNNRTDYGDVSTGLRAVTFMNRFPGFKEAVTGLYLTLEIRSDTDFTINIRRPEKLGLIERYLEKIPVRFLRPADALACNSVVEAVFLGHPPARPKRSYGAAGPGDRLGKTPETLYSYSYLACADSTLISSDRLLDKYMEKYGNYDAKDYDRSQIVYQNVKGQYEVRVRPVTSSSGKPALAITVTDDGIIKLAYDAWRKRLREVEESAKAGL